MKSLGIISETFRGLREWWVIGEKGEADGGDGVGPAAVRFHCPYDERLLYDIGRLPLLV